MGSAEGALKAAAARTGYTVTEYLDKLNAGLRWCFRDQDWEPVANFGKDTSRSDGIARSCLRSRRVKKRMRRILAAPSAKVHNQATNAVRVAIARGELPRPGDAQCADCGRAAQQYHHHLGYDQPHWLDVIALCRSCHQKRHWKDGQ